MRKEIENKNTNDLNIFSQGNIKLTKNISFVDGKKEKKMNTQLGKKRIRNFEGYNNNNSKQIYKNIQIEKYKLSFDLNEENEIEPNNGFNYISLWNSIMNIQDLSDDIRNLMKELNIDKNNLDACNKLHSDISTNKIAISRLNLMINFLRNSNIVNLNRKIVEALLFELFKNNQEYFELINYKPAKTKIEELKSLICIKLKDNKEKYQKEIERLTEMTNK